MKIEIQEIERYLSEVKDTIRNGRYQIARNGKRQSNIDLFFNYVMDEAKARDILLSLVPTDFSEILKNEHKGYEHEILYVFGKDVKLLERYGAGEKTVSLYIKFNRSPEHFVVVISFHEQRHPLTYYFK